MGRVRAVGGHEHWRALGVKGDNVFFAGLLEGLAQWWDSLGWAGQVLMTALGVMLIVMLIMVLGGSFALAMGATGVMAWGLSHGQGLAALARDPRNAVMGYVTTVAPGRLCLDVLDLLTFIPGSAFGRTGRWAAGGGSRLRARRGARYEDLCRLHRAAGPLRRPCPGRHAGRRGQAGAAGQ